MQDFQVLFLIISKTLERDIFKLVLLSLHTHTYEELLLRFYLFAHLIVMYTSITPMKVSAVSTYL